MQVGREGIQLHGGIGMTRELAVGHCLKRLTAIDLLFGSRAWHLERHRRLDTPPPV